ncbi:MAG: hypothetical protein WC332_02340 [Clostridia bacterium]|jgi:hypothetical protein
MTPEQIQTAVTMRATQESYRDIAASIGVSAMTAHRNLQKDEINQLIKNAQTKLIQNGLDTAIDNQIKKIKLSQKITDQIDNGEELKSGAVKALELGHDAEKQILQSVGIHNAHTQSITLNQILVDNRTELSPAIESMLMSHMKNISGANIEDAEIIESVEGNDQDSKI